MLSTEHLDCWGYGGGGQLGNGTTASSDVPVAVHKITNAAALVSYNGGYCALLSTSHVDCWGYGGDGELGDGSFNSSDVPVAVAGITDAKAVASGTGSSSSCALLSTGQVKCWGYNASGQLGNGTMTHSDVPVTAMGITDAKAVGGANDGGSFCAVLSTGHLKCWGYNGSGQLGNGTTTTFSVPVSVKNVTTATDVRGTNSGFCAVLSPSTWTAGGMAATASSATGPRQAPMCRSPCIRSRMPPRWSATAGASVPCCQPVAWTAGVMAATASSATGPSTAPMCRWQSTLRADLPRSHQRVPR